MPPKNSARNYLPEHGIRVPANDMRQLVADLFATAGTSQQDAEIMADLLVQTDMRCVLSHGTQKAPGYLRMMLDGQVNPRPEVKVVDESTTTLVLDGDGGMGHLPCYLGTQRALEKAREHGTAALTTGNHFHFGAAGKYSRMALAHDCIGMAISSHRFWPDPEKMVTSSISVSPLSIAIPSGEQPPLVLDMGAMRVPDLFEEFPALVFKGMGLGAVFQALGGILAGIYKPEFQEPQSQWESNQGSFIAVFDPSRFMPVDAFKKEMDRYIGQARSMQPLPGMDRAELAGGMEWHWEREFARDGIPVGSGHREALEGIAAELGVETPFGQCEHTRF